MAYNTRSIVSHISLVLLVAVAAALSLPLDWAFAQTVPDPMLLPVADSQTPDTAGYNAPFVRSLLEGSSYSDPTTRVTIYKLTSSAFPTSGSTYWGHAYSEGGDEISLPCNGNKRTIWARGGGVGNWLFDFDPATGQVSNPRRFPGPFMVTEMGFTFSNNPATPCYLYVAHNDGNIRRYSVSGSTVTEVTGGGWPVTGETNPVWLHQSANDGLFTWMRAVGAFEGDCTNPCVIVGYDPNTTPPTKKTLSIENGNEPRIDRGGRYVGVSLNSSNPADGPAVFWDFEPGPNGGPNGTVVWNYGGVASQGNPSFSHVASLRGRWYGVNWNLDDPGQYFTIKPDVPNSATNLVGRANARDVYGNGQWIQNPSDLDNQWALFHNYNGIRPSEGPAWLAPGGMVFITANGQRRLLGHHYNTAVQSTQYERSTFAKLSSDGRYVLFTSNMNGGPRSDLFLAEVPTASGDTTPPTVAITGPTNGTTVSGTVTVSANASDNVGVLGVQFRLDGAVLGTEDTTDPYAISWDTRTTTNGPHTLTAVARDAAGNTATSAGVPVTVDNAPPTISAVAASTITATSATITWTTNEASDSQVEYGLTTAYGSSTALNQTMVTAHSVPLSGLTANTLYHYRVKSRDAAGNLGTSGDFTFTTSADTTPPTVAITAPANGATVSGTVTVSANASDNVGVVGVRFRLDGADLGTEDTTDPYAISWDTRTTTNGAHTLTAVARDAAGNSTTSAAVNVTVNNDITPPTISAVAASNITASSATITWTTNEASDSQVEYGPTTAYGSSTALDPTMVTGHSVPVSGLSANTLYHYRVKSRDAAGNLATSGDFTFTTAAPEPGFVGHWKFNEGSGGTAADASGNGNTGTINGAAWTPSGKIGSALSFNGSSSYVQAADINALTPGSNATFEAWVFLNSAPTEVASVFNKWSQTVDDEYLLGINPNQTLYFTWKTTAGSNWGNPSFNETSGAGSVPLNAWTHIAVVRSGTTLTFYINGNLDATRTAVMDTNPFRNGINTLRLGGQGRGGRNRFFNGRLDEMRIYNRALTQAEIQNHALIPLVAAYGFNEGSGSSTSDASRNGNTGTINGAAWTPSGKIGSALSFNGSSSYVQAADINALTPGSNATFEAWVFLNSAPTEVASVFNKWSQTVDDEYLLGINPNQTLYFAWKTTAGSNWGNPAFNETSGAGPVPLNAWTHIAVVRSGTTLTFYINGNLDATRTAVMDTNPFRNGINTLRLGGQGRGGRNRFFNGRLDEMRIYNRALTQDEIRNEMTTTIGR